MADKLHKPTSIDSMEKTIASLKISEPQLHFLYQLYDDSNNCLEKGYLTAHSSIKAATLLSDKHAEKSNLTIYLKCTTKNNCKEYNFLCTKNANGYDLTLFDLPTPPIDWSVKKEVSQAKVKKPRKTLYWGVELSLHEAHTPEILCHLAENKLLISQRKIHTTLLYVGGKENPAENLFFESESKNCILKVTGYGYNDVALALDVAEVKFADSGLDVQTFAVKQHVTIALAAGTKAVDSVKTLIGEGTVVLFDKPLYLEGILTRYF